jgi:hypothetical protein
MERPSPVRALYRDVVREVTNFVAIAVFSSLF